MRKSRYIFKILNFSGFWHWFRSFNDSHDLFYVLCTLISDIYEWNFPSKNLRNAIKTLEKHPRSCQRHKPWSDERKSPEMCLILPLFCLLTKKSWKKEASCLHKTQFIRLTPPSPLKKKKKIKNIRQLSQMSNDKLTNLKCEIWENNE